MNGKAFAIAAVLTVLCASCAGFTCIDNKEEPDGLIPLIIVAGYTPQAVAIIAGAAATAGFVVGWEVNEFCDSDDADTRPYLRLAAANNTADTMSVASVFTANAMSNYSQLWSMTKNHWIRQAELESYTQWDHSAAYDGNSVLRDSRLFENNAVMSANAVAQINSFIAEISEKIAGWQSLETYSGKMSVGLALDNTSVMSAEGDFGAEFVSVADASGKTGSIYIGTVPGEYIVTVEDYVPGCIWNFGSATVIKAEDGTSFILQHGRNSLSELRSAGGGKAFADGIYTVSDAVIGGDTLSAVLGDGRITLKAGIAFRTDGQERYAVLDGEKISFAGSMHNGISFKVSASDIPAGEELPSAVDLTNILKAYQILLDRLYWTSVSASNSASAVWNVYAGVNEKNYGVTTLMSSNVYDSAVLSEGMNEVLTLSAMQQLAAYYDAHSGDLENLDIGLYGNGMTASFVRGNILDEYGNPVYRDVIFTPFFQSDSVKLERGTDYTVGQNALVAVWSDGKELSQWYSESMGSGAYETLFVEKGYTFQITQLGMCDSSGMHNVSAVDFTVSKVNYIEAGKANLSADPDPGQGAKNILKLVCIVAGAILIMLGIVFRRFEPLLIGTALMVFGLVFADAVFDWVRKVI